MPNKLNSTTSLPNLKGLDVGFDFKNTYTKLPDKFFSRVLPGPVKKPSLLLFNQNLASDLGLNFSKVTDHDKASIFSGSGFLKNADYISQAYAGHQFGYFTVLGDGRAMLVGEHITPKKERFDVQLKGSGLTPYSRSGDGRAAIGPVLREYLVSEAMFYLGVSTTRSLAAVATGEKIIREKELSGAVLTRVAKSHVRVGTFQYIATLRNEDFLKKLFDYSFERHFDKTTQKDPIFFLKQIIEKQISLVVDWMRVGFVHGVMNTDNMAISGETIDYGPCAFLDNFDFNSVFSSIDHNGRYAYGNQPSVAHWNLVRLAECLIPLIDKNETLAIDKIKRVFSDFPNNYKKRWLEMMRNKIGFTNELDGDESIVDELLSIMTKNKLDFTNTFSSLTKNKLADCHHSLKGWLERRASRLKKNNKGMGYSESLMKKNNPCIIPRNHVVENVLNEAEQNNLGPFNDFAKLLQTPYKDVEDDYYKSPPVSDKPYKTFCGT